MRYFFKSFLGREPEDIREFLSASATIFNDKILFSQKVDGEVCEYSYKQYKNDIDALGTEFLSRNFGGKAIIVMGENCYTWALVYMTVICGVGTIVPVDKNAGPEKLAEIAGICEAAAVFCSDCSADSLEGLPEGVERYAFSDVAELVESGRARLNDGDGRYLIAHIDSDETAIISFEKKPSDKLVGTMLSHRNVCSMLYRASGLLNMGERDVVLSVLPLHHIYEAFCGLLAPIYFGASAVFGGGIKNLVRDMNEARPTAIVCTPLIAKAIYKRVKELASGLAIEKKTALAAASVVGGRAATAIRKKMYAELHDRFGGMLEKLYLCGARASETASGLVEYGFDVICEYGLTEFGFLLAVSSSSRGQKSPVCVPLPGGIADIYNIKEDGTGEIRYKGDNVILGYFKDPEKTVETIRGGWFYTGDMGYIDRNGLLHVTGRKKNTIVNAGGKNIIPEELEARLGKSCFVKECVVVGIINDRRKDYDLVAVIYPDREAFEEEYGEGYTEAVVEKELEAAVEHANSLVQSYKHIESFVIRNTAFEKNRVGKIKRAGVAASVASEHKGRPVRE